jgi:hypothetical protein
MIMDSNSSDNPNEGLTLQEIDSQRSPEDRTREGKSGDITYQIEAYDEDKSKIFEGKIIEVGTLEDTKHQDLQPLFEDKYTHYGIFRLSDRSTTTVVQDEFDAVYKVFSFSSQNVKVSYRVRLTQVD